ncbi:MAG: LysM peptidoglycan-binding domain-containing protein [Chloroflexi bacterium]|nr:LysM peptidoglycan-binding domain-containing protein [Chloroflexota bacterium]
MMRRPLFLSLVIAALLLTGLLSAAAQDAGGTATYTVQPRDVLDLIAASYDVDTTCLAEANDLANPNKLEVGQVILIDFSCPRYRGPAFVANPRNVDGNQPAAQGGQGGGGGAPQAGPDDQTYVVEPNDTLDTIAQAFNVSVISLQLANNLDDPNFIFAGDTIIIPGGAPPYGAYPALGNPRVAAGAAGTLEAGQGGGSTLGPGDQEHVVQPRQTLDSIGAQYDKQVACIAEANNLENPNLLYAGQIVVVPGSCPAYDGYDIVPNRQQNSG